MFLFSLGEKIQRETVPIDFPLINTGQGLSGGAVLANPMVRRPQPDGTHVWTLGGLGAGKEIWKKQDP